MKLLDEAERRPYTMRARAEAAEATERRILDAAIALFGQRPFDEVALEDVAATARVAVKTVLRRFGSKELLFLAAFARIGEDVARQRDKAPAGKVEAAVANLIDHYEHWGDLVLHLLAQELRVPAVRRMTEIGRLYHQQWVERVFARHLPRSGTRRRRRAAQLTAVTDVYLWKILRRDMELSRRETEVAVRELVSAVGAA